MRRILPLALILLTGSPAFAETMLEQARTRGAASAQDFEDDPTNALPKVPWVTETESTRLFGADASVAHFNSNLASSQALGVGLVGQVRYFKLEQPQMVGQWGQSWGVALGTGFGAEASSSFGLGNATAQFGTLATLATARHAFFLRFSGDLATFRDARHSFANGFFSIPFGLRMMIGGAPLEVGAVPALGWASLLQESVQYGSGPIFMGARVAWKPKAGFVELQQLRGLSPADATMTTLLTCGHYRLLVLCAEGNWLHLHDLSRGDEARFARVGIRIGIGGWENRAERSLRKWALPDVQTR